MPGGHKNIKPSDGKQFSSEYQPKKNGRPLKIYTILRQTGYGSQDVKEAFQELGFYDETDLKKVANDKSKPVIVRIVAKQFIKAMSEQDYVKIREIMEHVIGKPVQPNETKLTLSETPQFSWADEEEEEEQDIQNNKD